MRITITTIQRRDAVCLEIEGELDALTAPGLAAELNTLIRRSSEDVIVDLRKATFMDSAGLQLLLATQRRLSGASRRFTVLCRNGPISRVIELARLGDILGLQVE